MFFAVYAPDLVGVYPTEFDIDGGMSTQENMFGNLSHLLGVQQTEDESFDFNGEPSLDLEYAMALVTSAQNITLYQVGDLVQGGSSTQRTTVSASLMFQLQAPPSTICLMLSTLPTARTKAEMIPLRMEFTLMTLQVDLRYDGLRFRSKKRC